MEPKSYGLYGERFFHSLGVWFYTVASLLLVAIVWFALKENPLVAFGAVVGSTAFFITHGFKQNAEQSEKHLMKEGASDTAKIFYLEVVDTTFSIDGVLGAFAFTLSIPLILLGKWFGRDCCAATHHKRHRTHQEVCVPKKRSDVFRTFSWHHYDIGRIRRAHT